MRMELESKVRMASWQIRSALALILTACAWGSVMAAGQPLRRHVAVDLIAEKTAVVPRAVLTVAVRERIEPDWHTYWTNPGDSGEPTSIAWTLPEGFSAGPILWPLPHIIEVGPLVEYGFDGE